MAEENQPYHIASFNLGANTSDEKELTGSKEGSGEYVDGRNQRSVSSEGNTGDSEKISGEELFYQQNVGGGPYTCIGAITVNKDILEVWAAANPAFPTFIRVNGIVVLKSLLFDYHPDKPLQLDRNENELGGEVFMTDDRIPPFIFNIQDLVDSLTLSPNKYFSAFDPLLYQINLFIPLDIPVFVGIENVGGGGGLPVGVYAYQLRYSNRDGDRTNISQRTPQIPIVQNYSAQSAQYPGVKTYGQEASPDSNTRYGIKLRFRVTNLQGYDFVELIRTSYNTNGGISFVPAPKIIAKVDIFNGEISVREFTDPVESNTSLVLSDEDVTREITYIESAKAIRYFDRRVILMNVKLASKESDLQFSELNGKKMFPVIDKLGTIGFNDAYNFVYRRHTMHGERIGYGVECYDGVGGKGFTTKVPGFINYQMPNRRDEISAETALYSYGGTVKTTDVFNNIVQTHEVFDHVNAISKQDTCSFKNIYHNKKASFILGTKLKTTVNEDCDETDGEIESHGAKVYTFVNVGPYYNPFTPTRANDTDVDGHNYRVNTEVCKAMSNVLPAFIDPPAGKREPYTPRIFAPEYYSQGMALNGISNFPIWAKAFSVTRTEPAGRVVAQGIGIYRMSQADFKVLGANKLTTKDADRFWFFSPDIENGIVSGRVIDDIIESPENYSLQFVAPLGFASEVYAFDANNITELRDRCVDMMVYARMQRDKTDAWEINPMEDSNMGFDGGDGYRYIGYGKFRNTGQQPLTFAGVEGGNKLFGITEAERISEGRGTYMSIQMDSGLYGVSNTGGTFQADFEDQGMKDFTEPFYIVNIVRDGAIVRDQNIENYRITSHYQKLESIIGEGKGTLGQKFILVDERWEDCIPALDSTHPTASTDRYIYIKRATTLAVEKWINVTYKTPVQIAAIALAISTTGSYAGGVTGMYRHEIIDGENRFFNIVFSVPGFYPLDGDKVLVRYDNTAPIRFWGGDSVVGESVFAPIDREASANGEGLVSAITDLAPENQFQFGIGFPYRLWKLNPRYYQIRRTKAGALANVIQDRNWGYLGLMRQLCVMFTAESRIALPYAHNNDYPLQFFPLTHYVIRPHRWDPDLTLSDNNIYPEYEEDYGATEKDQWKWGGFRFRQNINPDYSTLAPKEFVSKPKFGFVEKTKFYTRVMWSLPRQINQQNTPGLKTFPANNSFDIDDNQGEIKRAWNATTDKGENIYAVTDSGICLLVTKKSILSDLDAGELAYMAASTFVKQQYWINKEVGMSDQLWRSAAEGYIPVSLQDGSEVRVEALFFANNESVFRFMNNELKDIGRIKYHNTIFKKSLEKIQPGFASHVTAVFDKYHQEYWLHVDTIPGEENSVKRTDVFSQKNERWFGYFDYRFDRFVALGNKTFAMRDVKTYELGKGFVINGTNIVYEVTAPVAPKQFVDKEFIRVRINTGDEVKPVKVEFYKKHDGPVVARIDSSLGPLYLKKYRGWEGYVPRMLSSESPERYRLQGRMILVKITHDLPEDFRVIDVGIQYKEIK
jgi:hypothetical protein